MSCHASPLTNKHSTPLSIIVMEGGIGVVALDSGGEEGEEREGFLPLGLKLRRLVGNRGGTHTPYPSWRNQQQQQQFVSARELGAGLWEISNMSRRRRILAQPTSSQQLKYAGSLTRHVESSFVPHPNMTEGNAEDLLPASPASYYSSLEVSSVDQMPAPDSSVDFKRWLRGSGYGLKTSSELLQVLERILSLEKQHASNISLVKALKAELGHAQSRIKKLMQEQKVYHQEMDDLMERASEDGLVRKKKEQNKIKSAVRSIKNELEDEKKSRRCSESLHHKLGKELSEMNSALKKASSDLETERKRHKLLENLCDEFAKGVLKQIQEKDADPKLDRFVLDISETWLKSRSQLKIAEFQENEVEKKTITERLFSEIISFLQARNSYGYTRKKECTVRRHSVESVHINGAGSEPRDAEDDDSIGSDRHSNLKLRSKECIEKTEGRRKSNLVTYPDKMKGHDICNLKVQFEDLCVEEEQLVDSLKRTHFRELSECSSKQPQNIRENSLKEKLLEARLEGRYARLKASQAFSDKANVRQ